MKLNTASAIVSFCRKLEEHSAEFYDKLAQQYTEYKEPFESFIKESRRNSADIQRVYYGVISDALEGCFSFDIDVDDFTLKAEPTEDASYSDNLARAIEIEDNAISFYTEASQQSKSLMADIPRAFEMVTQKRKGRRDKLIHLQHL